MIRTRVNNNVYRMNALAGIDQYCLDLFGGAAFGQRKPFWALRPTKQKIAH